MTDDVLGPDPTAEEVAKYLRSLAFRLEDAISRLERLAANDRRGDGG